LVSSFDPEDEGDMILRNVGWLSTVLCPRRQNSWSLLLDSKFHGREPTDLPAV
jgi:hypothetical protein